MSAGDSVGASSPSGAGSPEPAGPRGLMAWFAGNPVAANLLMAAFVVGGLLLGQQVPVQYFPEYTARMVEVTVESPGASPAEVQADIVSRIEDAVIGLSVADRVVAASSQGLARVEIEIPTFANPDAALLDIETAVNSIENFPPANAELPDVTLVKQDYRSVTLAVSSPSAGEGALRQTAESVREELLRLPSVALVKLIGTRDREIAIEADEEQLRRYGLTFTGLASQVRESSVNLTFGELTTESGGVVLHTVSKKEAGEDFADIPVITGGNGTIVPLGAVAKIRDGFVDNEVLFEVDGVPAILVATETEPRRSITDVREEIGDWMAGYAPPAGIDLGIWEDRSALTVSRNATILWNAVLGTVLVLLSLLLVFDLRVATWITVGIPFSFIGSLVFFGSANLTINFATMFAFFLLVGLVVDDAVVVGESIAAERERGKSGLAAAIAGAKTVVGPVTIACATTLIAMMPFLFLTEGATSALSVIPYVAFFVLGVSLIEAFFILPAHLAHGGSWSRPPLTELQRRTGVLMERIRDGSVMPAASWALRKSWTTLALAAAFVLAAVGLVRVDAVRTFLFPAYAVVPVIHADIGLPMGTPFAATRAVAEQVAEAARAVNGQLPGTSVESVSVMVGSDDQGEDVVYGSHLASVYVDLADQGVRTASIQEIEAAWRRNLGDLSQVEDLAFRDTLTYGGTVSFALTHDDPEMLAQATAEMRAFMETLPGASQHADTMKPGKRHLEIDLQPVALASGLTPGDIGRQLRDNLLGVEVQRLQRGLDEVRVMMRYPPERRRSLGELSTERIQLPDGGEIPLLAVADLVESREPAQLVSIDGRQGAQVSAFVDAAFMTPGQARDLVTADLLPGLAARFPGLVVEADGTARTAGRVIGTLAVLLPIALVAMYALMAAFLRSYWKPVVAAAGIPLAWAGGIFFHWILGWDLTITSLYGLIAVAGVVVNDSLLLLDQYRTFRMQLPAMPAIGALTAATRRRFRAVFLTSVTTVLGLSPMLYERNEEVVFLVQFVVSILGGLVLSAMFTLFVLPAAIMVCDGLHE